MSENTESLEESEAAYISLRDAVALFPVVPSYVSVHRWATRGAGALKLQSIRVGGRLFTTAKWVAEFIAALNTGGEAAIEAARARGDQVQE